MPEHRSSSRYVLYVILVLSTVNVFNYMDRMALAVLSPLVKADLDLSDAELGLLIGLAFSLFYAVCGIPIGRWADRGVRRNIIAVAITIWSVMTALSGAAQNFLQLFALRMGVGAGEAGSMAAGASIVCDYVPLKRRAGALAVVACGSAVGILAGMALAGWLGEIFGWRLTFLILGVPGLALAVIVRLTLREPVRGSFDSIRDDRPPDSLVATLGHLWRCRTYRLITLFLVANGFVQYGLNQWWPSFYARLFGLDLPTVGVYVGIAVGASGGIGVLAGGLLANKVAKRGVQYPLMLSAVALAVSAPTALASLFVSSASVSIVLVAVTGLLWGTSNGPVLAAQYSVVTSRMRGTAGSVSIFMIAVFGFGLGPFGVGLLSDMLAPSLGSQSLRYALLLPVFSTTAMVITLLAAARSLPGDLQLIGEQAEAELRPALSAINTDQRPLHRAAELS
jgi:predicted MFS family arabinose efflux permease